LWKSEKQEALDIDKIEAMGGKMKAETNQVLDGYFNETVELIILKDGNIPPVCL
jgi:hypothetical protein